MKKLIFAFSLLLLVSMKPVDKKKIVFFGDSITQMGTNQGGYIDLIGKTLTQKNIQDKYELLGAGVGGNKVYDLYLRIEEDVLIRKPDIVVIYVGINDVWHKTSGTGTDKDKYEKFYVAIIRKLQAQQIKVAVCTPTVIGEKKGGANPQDADLDAYSDVVRRLAAEQHCTLIDLRKTFVEYETKNNISDKEAGLLTTDRVHLTDAGNRLVAEEMINKLIMQ